MSKLRDEISALDVEMGKLQAAADRIKLGGGGKADDEYLAVGEIVLEFLSITKRRGLYLDELQEKIWQARKWTAPHATRETWRREWLYGMAESSDEGLSTGVVAARHAYPELVAKVQRLMQ